jgi:hypothetical protein
VELTVEQARKQRLTDGSAVRGDARADPKVPVGLELSRAVAMQPVDIERTGSI